MIPIESQDAVYEAISKVKAGSSAFGTNFYPSPPKLAEWIARKELWMTSGDQSVFVFRRECDFWHLHYCASSPEALERGLAAAPEFRQEKMVSDLIGAEPQWLAAMKRAGMRRYRTLFRMARPARQETPSQDPWEEQVAFARDAEADEVRGLVEAAFDHYAKQIPSIGEIQEAIRARNIFVVRLGSEIAGLLYFENHGVTSTLRFWTIAQRFRDRHLGGALMRHYLASQTAIRRFVLWVDEGNDDAIGKYQHFHYINDGIADYILANDCIVE